MAITTLDHLVNALANNSSLLVIDKSSLTAVAGQLSSLWRATGQPGQGAIPGAAPVVPNNATPGAFNFTQQTAPATSYLSWLALTSSNNACGFEMHDRIAHMAGLVFNVTTLQVITGLDLAPGALNPPAERLGDANYSDGQWFLEVYADGGATASSLTINVTYGDGSTGNLNAVAVGGTLRAGRRIALTPLIPAGSQGKLIRAINSAQASASTGTAGNFGFTYTRQRTVMPVLLANKPEVADWQALKLPEIPNGSCLQIVVNCSTTSTGTLRGQGAISHG